MAERFSGCKFSLLHSRGEVSVVGLLCKLLDYRGREPLQHFCPAITTTPPTHFYSFRSLSCYTLLLSSLVQFTSLDLFRRSFFGAIANIWASTSLGIKLRGNEEGWTVVKKLLQRHICV